MTDMVEKVARAFCETCFPGAAPWELQQPDSIVRRSCLEGTRAAIRALMEPTEKMKAKATEPWVISDYQAMLKAALDDS